jgi:hypothetical protein
MLARNMSFSNSFIADTEISLYRHVLGVKGWVYMYCIESTIEETMWTIDDMRLTRNTRPTRRETCLIVIFYITYPIWYALGLNPGLCSKKTATNLLSLGTDPVWICYISLRFNRLRLFMRFI